MFSTRDGAPLSQRNVQRSALTRATRVAGLDDAGGGLRFHDLRHTFASHLIIDPHLDVVQVSRILGHASVSTTLDVTRTSSTRLATPPTAARARPAVRSRAYSPQKTTGRSSSYQRLSNAVQKASRPLSKRRSAGVLDQNLTKTAAA